MIIKLKNARDFNHAVTYLQNQTYCFDRYNSQLFLRFPQVCQGNHALQELTETQGLTVELVSIDLLPALAA